MIYYEHYKTHLITDKSMVCTTYTPSTHENVQNICLYEMSRLRQRTNVRPDIGGASQGLFRIVPASRI